MTEFYAALIAAFFVLNVADMILTIRVIEAGGREGNPALAPLFDAIGIKRGMLAKIAFAIGAIVILWNIGPGVISWLVLIGLDAAWVYVVWHNWRVSEGQRR